MLAQLQIAVSHGCVRVDYIIIEAREKLVVECALVEPLASGQAESWEQRHDVAERVDSTVDQRADPVSDGERLREREHEIGARVGAPFTEGLAEIGGTLLDAPDILGRVEESPDARGTVDEEAAHFTSRALPLSLQQVVDDAWNNGDVVERVRDHDLGPCRHHRLPLLGNGFHGVRIHAAVELDTL